MCSPFQSDPVGTAGCVVGFGRLKEPKLCSVLCLLGHDPAAGLGHSPCPGAEQDFGFSSSFLAVSCLLSCAPEERVLREEVAAPPQAEWNGYN